MALIVLGESGERSLGLPRAGVAVKVLGDLDDAVADGLVTYAGPVVGGHEIAVIGCDVQREVLIFRNSWGPSGGVDGDFLMTYQDFVAALTNRGDATVPVW